MASKIKIWAMNDCDWMAAETQLEAALGYAEHIGSSVERLVADELIDLKSYCPLQLSAAEMRRLKYSDEDDEGYGKPGYKPRSFKEQLERMRSDGKLFPRFFASTEY